MRKLKLKGPQVNRAKKRLRNLILEILKTHPRTKPVKRTGKRTITKDTGNLFKNIKPKFMLDGKSLTMEVSMMEYYQWLDAGTEKIQPWFFTEEIMDSSDLINITEELLGDMVEERLFDMLSSIKKK